MTNFMQTTHRFLITYEKSIISFLICFCVLLPLKGYAQQTPSHGGQLVSATTSDPKSFNDILAKETSTTEITSKIFEGLTTTDGVTGEVLPHLAESWSVDDSGLQWTFYLRNDVRWFDGEVFNADDVVFTFNNLIFNEDIPNSARDIYTIDDKIFMVEKLEEYVVQITLPVRFAPFLKSLSQSILPEHILRLSVEEGRFNFTWGIDTKPEDIIGTGPYKLAKYKPGQRIVFERNENYWKKDDNGASLPYIDKLIYLIVQNEDVELLKFMDGELDYIVLRASDFPLIKPREQRGDFEVLDIGAAKGTNFIFFNMNQGVNPKTEKPFVDPIKLKWFTNLSFRQAVAHAIDKDKIIEIVMNGFGYHQDSAMSPSAGFFYNPNVIKYAYDLDKGRQILSDAGFKDRDGDGVIEDIEGNPV
ncbi:MAG: peptide/nickel transport system substrate-binding protein, partial [Candidatus Omnitrophota bacterium]